MKLLRRIAIGVCVTVTLAILAVTCYSRSIEARITSNDAAFAQIQFGQRIEDVVASLGRPDELSRPLWWRGRPKHGIHWFAVYRVDRRLSPPVIWTIGLDDAGRVVSKHREASGC